jgi:hypothetical protein
MKTTDTLLKLQGIQEAIRTYSSARIDTTWSNLPPCESSVHQVSFVHAISVPVMPSRGCVWFAPYDSRRTLTIASNTPTVKGILQ